MRACKQVRIKGKAEDWVMVTCDSPGMVTLQPNSRLCRHELMSVAQGVTIVKPDEPFLIKVCNFGPDQAIIRKGCTVAFAEPHQGQVLLADQEIQSLAEENKEANNSNPLDNIDLNDAPPHLHSQIKDMLAKHGKMWDGTLGVIHATEHAIVAPEGTVPIRAQPYRTGAFKQAIIMDQINKMLKLKVVKPSHSAWASPVVIVPKKYGKARSCVDYRRLNNITKKDAYPLPRMEDCLDSLGDAKVFTSLDCTAGYWQVSMRKEDQKKTALTSHYGIFEWTTMPFGLTNAPATFQRALNIILSGLKWQICLVYLDDVIIFSSSAEQHIKDVDQVLKRLREAGVTLNLEKCKWFTLEVEYLGHTITPGELHVLNKNTGALRVANFPTTKTQMNSFLGMCNVYRRFVQDFTKRARRLNALTKKDVPPDLPPPSPEEQASFEDLRGALVNSLILALPKVGRHLTLDVDASAYQLGCTLLQEDENGKHQPLGSWSRGLLPAELNYSTTERECLGIVWADTSSTANTAPSDWIIEASAGYTAPRTHAAG